MSIVIYKRTEDGIYVAADSRTATTAVSLLKKEGFPDELVITETFTDTTYKIHFEKNIGMAFLGSHSELSLQCAKEACLNSSAVEELAHNYVRLYMPKLTESLEQMRLNHPEGFEKIIDPLPNTISEILFFGYDSDKPFGQYVYFLRKDPALTASGSVELIPSGNYVEVESCCFGKKEQIEDDVKKALSWQEDIIPTINAFAAIAAETNPSTVGGPIDIVKVTPKGIEWLQRK